MVCFSRHGDEIYESKMDTDGGGGVLVGVFTHVWLLDLCGVLVLT